VYLTVKVCPLSRKTEKAETGWAKSIVIVGRHPEQKKAVPYTVVWSAGRRLVFVRSCPPEKVATPTVRGG